ncbi:MAG: hypothetical protein A2887_03805 [Alphaproteobacteria bacterium RIFCSPLOWO2_01_FULL_40_26]|nr:MAG: hypothetical protein A3D15_04960 [Alphaproteobacteria bacterium RIFCSPHIGHO2_02_FULL_40_34]OFW89016.1 MAG: hypothetical protein A2794_02625 [Alphaproteobacteria bacterium RIFCSPHIGHO2_01_FULL_40_8]OFW95323.1 MAG: hypothetical protein A2887_03805 [Alphaproteobacteria bacterium RIFCSPLOWO2_01_FULL_40_26]OFX09226.1 MAG: hypothetical protein A3H30_06510 [Alphaproteobacteria bacterium RIFCSPLOWO2_02_FULL_40_19]OFX11581.1 MAG: hypothetical protein A3G22_05115 [Alphaproteobacteria bacterium RI
MRPNRLYKIIILSLFSLTAFAQEKNTLEEKNLPDAAKQDDKKSSIKNAIAIPGQIQDSLKTILLNQKAVSLMFDDEQTGNIDRAIESLKNNQVFVPEEEEAGQEGELNEEEKKKKEAEDKAKQEKKAEEENEKSYIYLASVIYFTPNNWAVWINDQKITSETNKNQKELFATSVQKDRVKLRWTLSISKWKILSGRKSEEFAPKINESNQVEVEFELRPNQTFILSTTNIVEGRAVIALLKKREEEKKAKVNEATTKTTTPAVRAGQSGL